MKKTPNKTEECMILAALDLFHLYGVNATSVDQILLKSKTGKGQFTHYFKSKEGLILAVVSYLHEVIKNGLTPTGYEIKSWKDLERWFQSYIDFQTSVDFTKSCPMGTIGTDISQDQIALRKEMNVFLDWGRGELTNFFAQKKIAKELSHTVKPEALADLCISIMQGGMLLTKIRRDPEMFKNASKEALNYIQGLRIKKIN